jgi:septum formation protein
MAADPGEDFQLHLGSTSPRRRDLLLARGLRFDVVAPQVDESVLPGDGAVAGAVELARRKADNVSKQVDRGFVIAADTVVWGEGFVLGKPRDRRDARRMLELLSGRTHCVTTGYAVVHVGSRTMRSGEVTARVTMRAIQAPEIDAFLASGEADDKAGAYGIQGAAGAFVTQVDGSRDTVVGLPVQQVLDALAEIGWRRPTRVFT